jgi:hypothetical protein
MITNDPPCDFDAFVAQDRDISVEDARKLIRNWLASSIARAKLLSCRPCMATPLEERYAEC